MTNPFVTGAMFLTLGSVFAFIGFVGWNHPGQFAIANSFLMREADGQTRQEYGRFLAGCVGAGGGLLLLWGTSLLLTPLL